MRGKDAFVFKMVLRYGITPAYAGKSFHPVQVLRPFRDHPRVCGEKCHFLDCQRGLDGSPPRMRGKGVEPCNQRVAVRITPAYAGKRPAAAAPV